MQAGRSLHRVHLVIHHLQGLDFVHHASDYISGFSWRNEYFFRIHRFLLITGKTYWLIRRQTDFQRKQLCHFQFCLMVGVNSERKEFDPIECQAAAQDLNFYRSTPFCSIAGRAEHYLTSPLWLHCSISSHWLGSWFTFFRIIRFRMSIESSDCERTKINPWQNGGTDNNNFFVINMS